MEDLALTLDELSQQYCALHTRKEDLFWVTKMGIRKDVAARAELIEADQALQRFLQDPDRLGRLRELAASVPNRDDSDGRDTSPTEARLFDGWIAMLEANVIESRDARSLSAAIIEREAELERQRGEMALGYQDPDTGAHVPASSIVLGLMLRTDPDARRRRAAYEGLRSIETCVLSNGFLEIVKMRNELARTLGHEDYYAWRVQVMERMTKQRLFEVLGELEERTRAQSEAGVRHLATTRGEGALDPWNFAFERGGALAKVLDPYFSFGRSLARWGRSFAALGVRYRGATLRLDLVDRPGKYENGFMHGPELAFFDRGTWRPARVHFTANAVPGQVGSGLRATETLFHEGGHAAHFANILQAAPCFSQEFAPTSIAYAETQSMFMDSLVRDADWRRRYAVDASGAPIPMELIELEIAEEQPFRAWDQRAMLTIPFAERALYELPDEELTPERVLGVFRDIEQRLQGLTAGVRPVLSVPHLLAGESSAYYHAYVLAEMAVAQTRAHFLDRDGYLADNPRIGPDLAAHYWAPGNARTFEATLKSLTGTPLSPDALIETCNRSVDEALSLARTQVERQSRREDQSIPIDAVDLEAYVEVTHGPELVASTRDSSFAVVCETFEAWIDSLEPTAR